MDVQLGFFHSTVELGSIRGKLEPALLAAHTRLSSILAAILSQGGDELVLTVFYIVAVAFLVVAITGLGIGISMSRSITGAVHSLVCRERSEWCAAIFRI